MVYPLPDSWYGFLKWTGLVFCPSAAVLYGTVAPTWGWPNPDGVVLTINAIGVFIGTIIGASQLAAKEV